MDSTEIILALIALLGNCGWFISGRKHRQEVRKAKAEAEREEFDVSVQYIKEFKDNIYVPLQKEVEKLRLAIDSVGRCEHRNECPVVDQLHSNSAKSENLSHGD